MSNNPFKSNNRFNFIDEDHTNTFKKRDNTYKPKVTPDSNNFKKTIKPDNKFIHKPPIEIDINNKLLFPDFSVNNPICECDKINYTCVNDEPIVETTCQQKQEPIPTGWTKISNNNNTFLFEEGPFTERMIQRNLNMELMNDPNYIMYHAIETMKKQWNSYEITYDLINGEGSYNERFRLPPVYNSDTDEENEDININYDDNMF